MNRDEETQLELDSRRFTLEYIDAPLLREPSIGFTQRELRIIMKHVEGRNRHIFNKLKDFISFIDNKEGRFTSFDARVPKTPIIRRV
jgi:hypothetical protein